MIADVKNPRERFFAYARERHQIYLNREQGQPKPWTEEPVLQQYRFTNVFRELDKTTLWFKDKVREPPSSARWASLAPTSRART
jgi:hypothetical protein